MLIGGIGPERYGAVIRHAQGEPSYPTDEFVDHRAVLNAGVRTDSYLDCTDEPDETLLDVYRNLPV